MDGITFKHYLGYRVGNWFTWADNANFHLLMMVLAGVALTATVAYAVLLRTRLSTSLHKVVAWLISTDAGVMEETTRGALFGTIVSLLGLLLFALTLSIIQQEFEGVLHKMKVGFFPAIEAEHYVVLGFTAETVQLVNELCLAYEPKGGTVIAILSSVPKLEVENELRKWVTDRRGSSIIVRSGNPEHSEDLRHVSAEMCKTAILMPDRDLTRENQDAGVIRMIVALASRRWPMRGQVIAMNCLERNVEVFEEAGRVFGNRLRVVNIDNVLCNTMATSGSNDQLWLFMRHLCGFEGNDFYISKVPKRFHNMTFEDVAFYYPDAVLVGLFNPHKAPRVPRLCVNSEHKLTDGDSFVMIAEDTAHLEPIETKPSYSTSPRNLQTSAPGARCTGSQALGLASSTLASRRQEPVVEVILVVGWNELAAFHILAMDRDLAKGSTIISFDDSEPSFRKEDLDQAVEGSNHPLEHVGMIYLSGELGAIWKLMSIPDSLDEVEKMQQEDQQQNKRLQEEEQQQKRLGTLTSVVSFAADVEEQVEASCFGMTTTTTRRKQSRSPEPASGSSQDALRRQEARRRTIDYDQKVLPRRAWTWDMISRVFVLSQRGGGEVEKHHRASDDAMTLTIALQLQTIIKAASGCRTPPITMELHDPASEEQCERLGFDHYILSSSLPAMIMATVALDPQLLEVLKQIFTSREHVARKCSLSDYIGEGPDCESSYFSFYEISACVRGSGDVLVGWSKQASPASTSGVERRMSLADLAFMSLSFPESPKSSNEIDRWEFNPPNKHVPRYWDMEVDMILVISKAADSRSRRRGPVF